VSKRPRLYEIAVSHYSEKARWALDLKQVEYRESFPPPGAHMFLAMWLTRGKTKTLP
jgi:glutathione S-transferase